jgi:hypothetical protein
LTHAKQSLANYLTHAPSASLQADVLIHIKNHLDTSSIDLNTFPPAAAVASYLITGPVVMVEENKKQALLSMAADEHLNILSERYL